MVQRAVTWQAAANAFLRAGLQAFAAMLLAFAGALALNPWGPWAAMGLSAGLALAARWTLPGAGAAATNRTPV